MPMSQRLHKSISTLVLVTWIGASVLSYGLTMGAFQERNRDWSYRHDSCRNNVPSMMFGSLFGPFSLLVVYLKGDHQHGLRWSCTEIE